MQYLVNEMLAVLHDTESEAYYRRLAAKVTKNIIFEALSGEARRGRRQDTEVQRCAVRRHREESLR